MEPWCPRLALLSSSTRRLALLADHPHRSPCAALYGSPSSRGYLAARTVPPAATAASTAASATGSPESPSSPTTFVPLAHRHAPFELDDGHHVHLDVSSVHGVTGERRSRPSTRANEPLLAPRLLVVAISGPGAVSDVVKGSRKGATTARCRARRAASRPWTSVVDERRQGRALQPSPRGRPLAPARRRHLVQ